VVATNELGRRGLGGRAPRLELHVAGRRPIGAEVEEHGGEIDSRDPVDERVVGLHDQREALVGHALYEPALPQWLVAVELLRGDARRELEQLLLGPG
jgi:hypothetical protein